MTELATYIPGILLALSAVLLALMSPGPNILAVIGTSMGAGRKYGVALALGVATASFRPPGIVEASPKTANFHRR
jgi:amino acid exporter